jgi:hypothetical protein
MKFKILLAFTIALTLGWEVYAQTNNTGKITFFRPSKFVGSAKTPSLYIDGKQVLRMDNGRYYTIELAAGEHVLETATAWNLKRQAPVTVKLSPGDHLYFWTSWGLQPWPPNLAKEKIKKLKPLDAKWVISNNPPHSQKSQPLQ